MILEVDGQKVESREDVNKIRDTKKIGDTLTFKVMRDGETLEIPVTLTDTIEDTNDAAQQQQDQNSSTNGGWDDFWNNFFR